jgi:hypothetical protein
VPSGQLVVDEVEALQRPVVRHLLLELLKRPAVYRMIALK